MSEQVKKGTLYIVATPIGNLDDISYRAVKILSGVDLIAAEDTRTTKVLLNHFQIRKPLVSYHEYNERGRAAELLRQLESGASVAVVSDAGTPGISDPAYRIVHGAVEAGIPVVPIPGPSAFLAAIVVSGAPTDQFVFEGFLPQKKGRKTKLERLAREDRTIILYESPYRLLRTLEDIRSHLGNRTIVVARELTKKFEEILRGTATEMISHFLAKPPKGEFVLVIFPAT